MLSFEEYCLNKKIDATQFRLAEPAHYIYLKNYFEQMHPESFTAQKLFLINDIRRKYLLALFAKPIDNQDNTRGKTSVISKGQEETINATQYRAIAKPKMGGLGIKPIIKPKINTAPEPSEVPEKETPKPILVPKIPSLKPKIPKPKTED